jgi:hypothetical protein
MQQVFIVAPGPSLTSADCAAVAAWRSAPSRTVIAVNLAWRLIPEADLLFAGDSAWWECDAYRGEVQDRYRGECWTASPSAAKKYGLRFMEPPLLTNSGANAIALAARLGARRIYLLGFDYGPGANGRLHCHEDHPAPLSNTGCFEAAEMRRLAVQMGVQGVTVMNCSHETKLECFERVRVDQVASM